MKAPKFKEFISEKVQRSDIQVAILTKVNADSKSVVSNMILLTFLTSEAYVRV